MLAKTSSGLTSSGTERRRSAFSCAVFRSSHSSASQVRLRHKQRLSFHNPSPCKALPAHKQLVFCPLPKSSPGIQLAKCSTKVRPRYEAGNVKKIRKSGEKDGVHGVWHLLHWTPLIACPVGKRCFNAHQALSAAAIEQQLKYKRTTPPLPSHIQYNISCLIKQAQGHSTLLAGALALQEVSQVVSVPGLLGGRARALPLPAPLPLRAGLHPATGPERRDLLYIAEPLGHVMLQVWVVWSSTPTI